METPEPWEAKEGGEVFFVEGLVRLEGGLFTGVPPTSLGGAGSFGSCFGCFVVVAAAFPELVPEHVHNYAWLTMTLCTNIH